MKKKIDLVPIIYILMVYLALATERQNIYNVKYMSKYYISIIICIFIFSLLIIKQKYIIVINKKQLYIAKLMFLPTLCVFIYSLFINTCNPVEYSGFLSRSFGVVAYLLLAIIQAYIVYYYFGDKAIKYTFVAVVLSYLTSIIVAFKEGGISQFINIITDSSYSGSVLEMHEVAPIVSMLAFYYIYQGYIKTIKSSTVIKNVFICLIILTLSMKRIVFLSSILILALFFILKGKKINLLKYIAFFSILIISISYVYIYFIKSENIYILFSKYNINSMSRTELWKGISSQYEFSLSYLGRGLGFASIWMDNNWQYLDINGLTQSTGLHNDILKFYIDLGFLGFFLYIFNLLYMNTKRIYYKLDKSSALLYFLLISLQILIWFTDVISGYHNFQWIFYLIIFSLLSNNSKQSFVLANTTGCNLGDRF